MDFLSILNLVAAIQAFFLSFHFFLKPKSFGLLNKLLGLLCFCLALIVLNTYLNLSGHIVYFPSFQDIANNAIWFCGPALYLYTIYHDRQVNPRLVKLNTIPYLVPTVIDLLFDWTWYDIFIPFVAFSQVGVYLFLTFRYLILNYTKAKKFYNWILPSLSVFGTLLLLNFILTLLAAQGIRLLPSDVLQSFTTVLLFPLFYLAYKEMNATNDFGIKPKKYKSTALSDEKSKRYLNRIENAMLNERLYLDKTLTLQSFAKHLEIQPKYVSQLINQHLEQNFTDYLMSFRITEVKSKLLDPKNKHLTIQGMAEEAGFNSGSRFNFHFKKHTGHTPKEFQQLHSE